MKFYARPLHQIGVAQIITLSADFSARALSDQIFDLFGYRVARAAIRRDTLCERMIEFALQSISDLFGFRFVDFAFKIYHLRFSLRDRRRFIEHGNPHVRCAL